MPFCRDGSRAPTTRLATSRFFRSGAKSYMDSRKFVSSNYSPLPMQDLHRDTSAWKTSHSRMKNSTLCKPFPESLVPTLILHLFIPHRHIKRISLGVPEDKWDSLFEEILRVMKPGAAFEMIEEDLMFPGGAIRVDEENESIPENFNSHSVESALFSDSDTRQHSSASSISSFYFGSGQEIRNRNRPRSSSSRDSSSTATDTTNSQIADKTFRRRSVPVKGSDQKRSTPFDYATLTTLMGLGDGENGSVISEREDENHYQELERGPRYSGSDWDSLLPSPSGSHRNSSVEKQDQTTHDPLAVPSPANQSAGGPSPIHYSPLPLPSPSSSAPVLPSFNSSSPTTAFMSVPSVIPNSMGRGLEVEAIVEDEEGEKSATWASVNDDIANGQLDTSAESHMPSHSQEPTDSTIMPVKPQPSEVHRASISLSSKSTPLRHPLSVSTGSLTDLQLSSPYSSNPYAKLNYVTGANSSISGSAPPKRPLSTSNNGFGTDSSIHLPSMSFSQSMHSLSSSSPHSLNAAVDADGESRIISSGSTASPFLLRTLPKPPVNPRDHSMLEMIYNEMNAARFVNLSPLSLLPNLLGLYFKGTSLFCLHLIDSHPLSSRSPDTSACHIHIPSHTCRRTVTL